ncbi:MAG: c-type cytochrome [Chloroflexota bacterium]
MKEKTENYTHYIITGLIMTLLAIAGLAIYSLSETQRLANAAELFNSERVARGSEIYQEQCTACHGADGEGGSGPALNNRTVLKNTLDNVFFSVIRSGVPGTQMPAWSVDFGGPLTDEDVRDVVALLRSWEPTAPEIVAQPYVPNAASGARLFFSTCAACHGEDGSGTPDAPRINDPQRLQSLPDDWYRGVIRNGRPAKGMPTWGTVLSPNQIEDLVMLLSAWREGQQVKPAYATAELLENALYALEQGDAESAALHIQHAEAVTSGPALEVLRNASAQIAAGDLAGAQATLAALRAEWPLGDAVAGVQIYSASCAACHGVQGEGGIGTALQNNAFIQSQTGGELLQFILAGRTGTAMAGFAGRLDETQIADLIAFLRLWQSAP